MNGTKTKRTPPGRFWLRLLAIATGALVLIYVAGGIAIPRLIDVNTYRSMIEARASQRFGRPVALGRMELTVFPQISAVFHDVMIGGQEAEGKTVLAAPTVNARARLWPLILSRRLEITALSLDQPEVILIRDASGKWNWETMVQRKEADQVSPSVREKWAFTVGDIRINGGKVSVIDQAAEPGQVVTFSIQPLDLDLHGYATGRPFNLDLDGMMIARDGQGKLKFNGEVGPLPVPFDVAKLPVDGAIKADAFPLHSILPYVRSENGILSLAGAATSDLRLVIGGKETRAKGSLKLDKAQMALGGESPRSVALDFDATLDLASRNRGKDLDIRKLDLALPGGSLSLTGGVSGLGEENGKLALKVDGRDVNINNVAPLAQLVGVQLPLEAVGSQPFNVKGTIEKEASGQVKRLRLRNIDIQGIDAALYRGSDGSWSAGRGESAPNPQSPQTRVEVENLRIERSKFLIADAVAGHGRPVPLRLSDVELKVDHYGTGTPARGSLAASLDGGGRGEFSGTVGPETNGQMPVDAKIRLEQAKIGVVRQYLSGLFGSESGDGTIDLDVSVAGRTPERLRLQGTLGLKEVGINLRKADGKTERQVLKGQAAFDAVSEGGGERLTLNSCKVSLPSGTFAMSGTLDRRGGGTMADITLAPTRVKMEDFQSLASLVGFNLPGTMRSAEPIEVTLHARGDIATRNHLLLDGSLRTNHMTWETPYLSKPLENIAADIRFTGDGFETKGFSATVGETGLHGDFAVRNFGEPDLTFAIMSDRVNLSQALDGLSANSSASRERPPSGQDSMAKLKGHGSVAIRSGTLNNFTFSDLRGTVTVNGRVFRFSPLHFALYGGNYDGETEIDASQDVPLFRYNGTFAGVDAHALLSSNTNFKDALFGTFSGKVAVAGRGKTMDEIIHGLNGTGELTVKDGKFERVSMLSGLADVSGLFGEKTLAQVSRKSVTNETPFSTITSTFKIAGGRMTLDRFLLQTSDFSFIGNGGFGFDRHLDLKGRLIFSEAISRSLKEERSRAVYLGSEKGLVAIPLMIGGTVDRPSYSVDFGAAAEYAVEKTIADKLTEALFKKKQAPATPATPAAPAIPPPSDEAAGSPSDSAKAARNETPPANAEQAAKPTEGGDSSTPASGPQVRLISHGFRGNLLQPDLAVRGLVHGSHLASLLVVVTDQGKHEVHRDELLTKEIDAAYGTRPRSELLTVPFDIRIPGADLPPLTKSINVKLTAVTDAGATASVSFSEKKPIGRLF